jgi:uncharacterized radical SAM superfamily Fe-S cluster-containing enzyme
MSKTFARTQSVCPVCLTVIEARKVVGDDGNIYMEKTCPEHGNFRTLIWEDGLLDYLKWDTTDQTPQTPKATSPAKDGCPLDCGLCEEHERDGCCVLLELTNRCNLHCPVCFASAGRDGARDLSLLEISAQYDLLMARGGPFNIQLSGGEPTVRDDLPEIVALGREKGFSFFQLNTNGLRLASEAGYAKKLRAAGVSCVFLQFDGLLDTTYTVLRGRPLLREKLTAICACEEAGLPVVLVPTVAEGVNDGEFGEILRFALSRAPAVRGVHFQPMSYFGRNSMTPPERRLTIPRVLQLMESQMNGVMKREDFGGGGAESPYCSFHASYMRKPDGSLKALPRRSGCCCVKSSEAREFVADRWSAGGESSSQPDGDVSALDEFLEKARENIFTVSGMVFQDAWNLDLARLRRCYICEADTERGMVPFCAYNLTDTSGHALYRK